MALQIPQIQSNRHVLGARDREEIRLREASGQRADVQLDQAQQGLDLRGQQFEAERRFKMEDARLKEAEALAELYDETVEAVTPWVHAGDEERAKSQAAALLGSRGKQLDDETWGEILQGVGPKATGKPKADYTIGDTRYSGETNQPLATNEKSGSSKPTASQEHTVIAKAAINDYLRELGETLPEDQLNALAGKLAESGNIIDMDRGGNAIVDKAKFVVNQALGRPVDNALTNIENPIEVRKRVNAGVTDLVKRREDLGLTKLETSLDVAEEIIGKSGGVKGFSMTEELVGTLTNDSLNQVFYGQEGNENRQAVQGLVNQIINSRAGMAQTLSEERRVLREMGRGNFRDTEDVRAGLQTIRRIYEATNEAAMTAYPPEVVQEWRRRNLEKELSLIDLESDW